MGIYWWLLAGGVALAGLAITYRGLSTFSIHLYVLDVAHAGEPSVSSTLVHFRTPLIGSGLNFDRNAPLGNQESRAVIRDSTGKIYISAWSSQQPQIQVSTDLAQGFSTAISGSSAGETFFTFPTALALDAVDNLYVADKGQLELPPAGSTSRVLVFPKVAPVNAPDVLAFAPHFFEVATGVAVDSHGNLYVVSGNDPATNRTGSPLVVIFNPGPNSNPTRPYFQQGAIIGPIPDNQGSPTFPGYLTDPRQVALDNSGYIYVTNGAGPGIVVFPPSPGALAAPFGEVNCEEFRSPCGISICRKAIYVADPVARSVFVFGPLDIVPYGSGRRATPSRTITSGNADFAGPVGVYAVALPWFTRQRQSSVMLGR